MTGGELTGSWQQDLQANLDLGGKMELYIGGYAQGKLECIQKEHPGLKVIDEKNFGDYTEADGTVIIDHLHLVIKEFGAEAVRAFLRKRNDFIVICDEIGNGIVPVSQEERTYREETGRLLIELASASERVGRIICGMIQIIK